jgi:ankyrin repeat protein
MRKTSSPFPIHTLFKRRGLGPKSRRGCLQQQPSNIFVDKASDIRSPIWNPAVRFVVSAEQESKDRRDELRAAIREGDVFVATFMVNQVPVEELPSVLTDCMVGHEAVHTGYMPMIQYMFNKRGKEETSATLDSMGRTPLHIAVIAPDQQVGALDIVKYLVLECNSRLNYEGTCKKSPLCIAVSMRKYSMVNWMITAGGGFVSHTDLDSDTSPIVDTVGTGVIICAVKDIYIRNDLNTRMLVMLLSGAAAIQRCPRGHVNPNTNVMLDCKRVIDETDSGGCTALHWAVSLGMHTVIQILLEYNAQCDVQDDSGAVPLQTARANNDFTTIELLVQYTNQHITSYAGTAVADDLFSNAEQ